MRVMLRVLPLVLMSGMACEPAEPPSEAADPAAEMVTADADAVRGEMEAALDGYEAAAMAGQVAGMLAIWTDDALLLEPGMRMSGAELPAFYDALFSGGGSVSAIDIRTAEVFVHDDVAYSIGDYEETFQMSADAEPMSVHNNYFARWELGADGTWKIDRIVVGTVDAPEEMTQR